ncbi:MAG: hypothetical protein RL385_4330, partial [Pseudomonadota bacterium]
MKAPVQACGIEGFEERFVDGVARDGNIALASGKQQLALELGGPVILTQRGEQERRQRHYAVV